MSISSREINQPARVPPLPKAPAGFGADPGGIRVNIITEQSSLSRPAVSRHLNILKDAGLIKLRREGTKNYYYFDTDPEPLTALLCLLAHTRAIMGRRPERREQPL